MSIRRVHKDFSGMVGDLRQLLHEGISSPAVRHLAEEAIAGREDHILAVHTFVKRTFPYIPDPIEPGELFIHPNRMAEDYFSGRIRGGDCDDHATLNAAMLGSIGYRVRLALIDSDMDFELDHAVAEVFSDKLGEWIQVDTTSEFPLGWSLPTGRVVYVE